MTPEQLRRAEEVYFLARERPLSERAAFLNAACAGDPALRAEVNSLLKAGAPSGFLEVPVLGSGLLSALKEELDDALIGSMVGPWKVERLIGAGGMGAVYLAARADGTFEGHAAIKVVKRGMDTEEILKRFRAERRTLANLNHPNIATLLDAGSLPDGRPYLVMEYVAGLPITQYCRVHTLGTRERLRLFIAVCRAVQFAHQGLVVHRDIKPGNIVVTGDGTPKLLDFGIAKVLAPGGAAPAVTGAEERRLTPEYASPEQVEGLPVTTASDIYSLGVILYELLTGRQPYEFSTRSTAEVQRTVTRVVPPPPSSVAERPDTPPARLRRELRGDLDNIVMMAMRKEPQRRYASAERFASDAEAYLAGFPVSAQRDTLRYRTTKFVVRHRWAVGATAAAAIALGAGTAAVAWQANVARRQRDQAFIARDQAEAIAKFFQDMLAAGDPMRERAGLTIRQILDRTASELPLRIPDQPLVQAAVRSAIGSAYLGLGLYDDAEKQIRAAYQQRLALVGPHHHDTAESMVDLGAVLYAKGNYHEAEKALRDALGVFRSLRGEHNIDVARTLNNLGAVLRAQGRFDEAAEDLESAIRMRRADTAGTRLDLAESLNNYAGVLRGQRKLGEAEAAMRESLAIRRELLPTSNPLVAQSIANLAVMLAQENRLDEAELLLREAIPLELAGLGPDHPDRAPTLNSLASVLRIKGDLPGAAPLLREALRIREKALPAADTRVIQSRVALAEVLAGVQKDDEALRLVQPLARLELSDPNPGEPLYKALDRAATLLERLGHGDDANALRERVLAQHASPR